MAKIKAPARKVAPAKKASIRVSKAVDQRRSEAILKSLSKGGNGTGRGTGTSSRTGGGG